MRFKARSSQSPNAARHAVWPAERFYWSIAECPGRVVPLSGTLLLLMEDDLPVESGSLHAVGVRLDEQRVLICAASREDLATLDSNVVTLTPASIPLAGESGTGVRLAALNLLTHEFEPAPLRREKQMRVRVALGAFVLVTLLAALGLWRRAAQCNDAAGRMDAKAQQVMSKAMPVEFARSPGGAELALNQELVRLRQTRWASDAPGATVHVADASEALATYLALWPKDLGRRDPGQSLRIRTDFLSATTSSIALSIRTVKDDGDDPSSAASTSLSLEPSALVAKLPRPTGWVMEEPRLSARDGSTSLAIQLHRAGNTNGGTP